MPANKKHLTKSPLHRFLKISAGFVGGYIITESLFMVLMQWWNSAAALITLQFGGFMMWCTLLILAFIPKNGFKIWALYIGIALPLILLFLYFNT